MKSFSLGAIGLCLAMSAGLMGCQMDTGASSQANGQPVRADNGSAVPAAGTNQAGGNYQYTLAYPTGDRRTSVLLLEATGPGQVRVGQQYNYTVRVTNLTDTPLHDVQIRNLGAMPESATSGMAGTPSPADRARQAGYNENDTGTSAAAGATTRPTEARRTEMRHDGEQPLWTIGTLAPRQSQQRQFNEVADEVGTIRNCLAVSYEPTLCVAVQVVKPELQITKTAPTDVLICQEIPVTYHVTNTGTGVAQNVVVQDTLPEGLQTADGARSVTQSVGDLRGGESKDVAARLRATKTGQFTSRAVAKSGATEARSREAGTTVREPVLAVSVEAPEATYVGQAVNYRINIRNTGDAPAQNTVLHLATTGGDRIADRNVGTIEAGAARSVAVTSGTGQAAGQVTLTATAEATCARPASDKGAVAIRTIPALLLEAVDNPDPVQVGTNTTYTVTVKNQGSGPDANIRLVATLPPELKFVRGGGASEIRADGQKLTFAPISTLAAQQVVTWTVEAQAASPGDVRFEVSCQSDSISQPAVKAETTKLFDPNAPANPRNPAPGNPANPVAPGNGPATQPANK
jgi:uncharacterized repeat protein (TIGR01451 family)